MKTDNLNQQSRDKSGNPTASRSSDQDEKIIRHETIPGVKPQPGDDKKKASTSTTDEDLN